MKLKYYVLYFIVLILTSTVFAQDKNINKTVDRCLDLKYYTIYATEKVFNIPYWYLLGLAKTESNCRWVISLDGHGSIGYTQITPSMWDKILKPIYPDYKIPSQDHFNATAYILKSYHSNNPCQDKLWATIQAYNGGYLVYKEMNKANSCKYEDAKLFCRRKDVCVYMTVNGCLQYRNACDINYSYSIKVYNNSINYIDKKLEKKYSNIKYW